MRASYGNSKVSKVKNKAMKRVWLFTLALVAVNQVGAAEGEGINSKVIHHYTQFSVGYQFFEDVGGGTAHAVIASTSVDMNNLLFSVGGGYGWGPDDLEFWAVGGDVGYIIRLLRNRVNIIPRFGMSYNRAEAGPAEDSVTTIEPGLSGSFAINNRLSVGGSYTYVRALDNNEEDGHVFGPRARFALTETMGLDIGAQFTDEGKAFQSAFAAVNFHF